MLLFFSCFLLRFLEGVHWILLKAWWGAMGAFPTFPNPVHGCRLPRMKIGKSPSRTCSSIAGGFLCSLFFVLFLPNITRFILCIRFRSGFCVYVCVFFVAFFPASASVPAAMACGKEKSCTTLLKGETTCACGLFIQMAHSISAPLFLAGVAVPHRSPTSVGSELN